MKKLTLQTTIELQDKDAHFLYKYLKANGFRESLIAQVKNSGFGSEEQESEGIKMAFSARVEDGPDQTPNP